MKKVLAKIFSGGRRAPFWISLSFVAAGAAAVPLQEARVSQVIQDVRLLEAHAAPRPAVVNDKVIFGSAVRTGVESRTELTFNDLTITRLGANTIFSFTAGARQAELTQGAILLQVPPKAAPVRANTTGITVAVTGGTALLATGPPTKFMVLEGIGSIYPRGHPEKAVTVHGGEMVLAENGRISNPEKFDVKLVLETSALIVDFPPLANLPLILAVVDQQLAEQQLAGTTSQPLIRNLIDVIDQNANANPVVVEQRVGTPSPTVSPTPPPPSKFGTPSVITSPNPYLITSGTVITTDPSITTNGVTDFGKIYRGSADDGVFSLWAFGSTSAFDTALNIDTEFFADPNHLPIAVFEFQNLSLVGEPTIDTSNGGVTNLALIGVDGITSGAPGGVLTFTGLDLLLLATVNGSINLTSDVSFQGLNELAMYARGAGSDLILASPISNIGTLELAAEGSIQLTNPGTMSVGEFEATAGNNLTLQIGGSLLLNGKVRLNTLVLPGTTVDSGANLTLNVTGDYANNSSTEFSLLHVRNEGGHIETGGNINANIGGNLTATGLGSATESPEPGDFVAVVQNTNGLIDNGGNLTLTVNGNVQVNGLTAYVQNYDQTANPAGHIGTGGNIDIEIGGNLTANSYVDVFLNNRGGGMIDSGGNLTFNVGGALNIGVDAFSPGISAEFIISTRYDDIGGNTTPSFIGSDVSLFLHAASIDMAGDLFGSGVSNRGGSVIDGNATVTWDVPGDVNIRGTFADPNFAYSGASWWILNDIPSDHQFTPPGAGTIHGNATLTLNIGGDLTVAGDGSVFISNQRNFQATNPSGGTIDSDATLNVTAANFSVGGELDVLIDNFISGSSSGTGGSIGGNAAINLNLSGDLITTASDPNSLGIPGDAFFLIRNQSFVGGSPGGFVGGDATIDLSIVNASIAGLFDAEIDNFGGGSIGGDAILNVDATEAITAQGDAVFQILNNDGGHIGGNANILVTTGGAGDLTANSILGFVNNRNGGIIDSGSNVTFDIGGALTTTGDATFGVSNRNDGSGGGTIGSNVLVSLMAESVSVGGFFQTFVSANGGGSIQGDAINTVDVTGDLTAQQGILLTIADTIFGGTGNFTGGHIGGNAILTLSGQNITTPSTASGIPGTDVMAIEASIYPNTGGTVGGDAIVNVSASQDISAPGSVLFWVANGNYQNLGPGMIGGNAEVNVSASNISTGDFFDQILNYGGASIDGHAAINLTANTLSVGGNLDSWIDNSSGGIIAGDATINMNVSSTATVTNDATFAIYGSDGAASAAININGGSYNAGGQFLTYIDGDGTITFNNASAHADVLKVGALGANGVLNIGGGILSADTTLKLYASGSNGQLNFVSNVTLGGSAVKILAANTINILDGIVVTIGGATPAEVYTNNANYTGFGGNGTTTGTFAGAGANNPLPLNQAPPFGPQPSPPRRGNITTINVSSTADLLALLDGAVVGPDGRITISDSRNITNLRNISRIDMNGLPRGARRMLIHEMRDRSTMRVRGRQIL